VPRMGYWLSKTDPDEYTYADLALKHLRAARNGDLAFIYHTGCEKQIVGIAKYCRMLTLTRQRKT